MNHVYLVMNIYFFILMLLLSGVFGSVITLATVNHSRNKRRGKGEQ